jgi:hypothetical protein
MKFLCDIKTIGWPYVRALARLCSEAQWSCHNFATAVATPLMLRHVIPAKYTVVAKLADQHAIHSVSRDVTGMPSVVHDSS